MYYTTISIASPCNQQQWNTVCEYFDMMMTCLISGQYLSIWIQLLIIVHKKLKKNTRSQLLQIVNYIDLICKFVNIILFNQNMCLLMWEIVIQSNNQRKPHAQNFPVTMKKITKYSWWSFITVSTHYSNAIPSTWLLVDSGTWKILFDHVWYNDKMADIT